jgi:hypothetical protein
MPLGVCNNIRDLIMSDTFTLYGPLESISISKGGNVSLVGQVDLEAALRKNYPGCEIIDNRKTPSLGLIIELSAQGSPRARADSQNDFSPEM